jgi:hypothetical protein
MESGATASERAYDLEQAEIFRLKALSRGRFPVCRQPTKRVEIHPERVYDLGQAAWRPIIQMTPDLGR